MSNKPITTIRDGAVKATLWRNATDKGSFVSVEITRTYTDAKGRYRDTGRLSGTELLKAARLAHKAYDAIAALREQEGGAQ